MSEGWLFGPAGSLMPVPAPEPGVKSNLARSGGIHTFLDGSRSVDTIGYKNDYEFQLDYLEPDAFELLESMWTGYIKGPFWLIDPLKRNLLSAASVKCEPYQAGRQSGIAGFNSTHPPLTIINSLVPWNRSGIVWGGLQAGSQLRFDGANGVPCKGTEPMTFSVYLQPTTNVTVRMSGRFSRYEDDLSVVNTPDKALTANIWTRYSASAIPSNHTEVAWCLDYVSGATGATSIYVLSPQVEYGDVEPSPASVGGGCSRVVFESFEASSPYDPYRSVTMKLLEV